jgi:hypothetical protein
LIGVPLLALLPLLAMFGVFGESRAVTTREDGQLALQVDSATRLRYWTPTHMEVHATNLTQQAPTTITVAISRDYLDHFGDLAFVPDAERITAANYEVELTEVGQGETRIVEIEMVGRRYWWHRGEVAASIEAGSPLTVAVGTFVFP